MNKAKLKSYAPQARIDFIAAVTARANLLGLSDKSGQLEVAPAQTQGDVTVIAGQAWPAKVAFQREKLISRMKRDGFNHTCEAIAYTWFNRFAAIRYMELHDYLGHGHRALSSVSGGLPDILNYAADLATGGDSGLPGLKLDVVTEMKLAGNRDGDLYRMLIVAQCNALSRAMPFLFERIDDDSELLLPDNLLRSDSVIAKLVSEIPEEDWAEVEIIGWLYQFYISEKKDQVIGKVVKSEDIPAATQLFTPNWIVQYLVQNSVGRLWLMANPQSTLAKEWPYYITPAEQTPEVQDELDTLIQTRVREDGETLNPESITVLDPACGSGHILVVAYDVLKAIYLERGYQPRTIPRLILEKNLYGLDIDDRAAQMAGFALLMKARADDRRLFTATDDAGNLQPPTLNVLSLQESKGLSVDELTTHLAPFKVQRATIAALVETFEHAKTFGSLIQLPYALKTHLAMMPEVLDKVRQSGDMYANAAANDLLLLVQQAQVLAMQFDVVVANPPYMGIKGMNQILKQYASEAFPDSKSDLLTMFMERAFHWCKDSGYNSMVTMQSWMFLSSFETMRIKILSEKSLLTMAHLGARAFSEISGEVVQTTAFVIQNRPIEKINPVFIKLIGGQEDDKERALLSGLYQFKNTPQDHFKLIPGSPIAYWLSEKMRLLFNNPSVSQRLRSDGQILTGNNARYLRQLWEVDSQKVGESKHWKLHHKGGDFRRWYGNVDWVVDWSKESRDFYRTDRTARIPREELWHLEGITWSTVTSSIPSFRKVKSTESFNKAAPTIISNNKEDVILGLAFLNSKISEIFLNAFNPTLNCLVDDVENLPFLTSIQHKNRLISLVESCIQLSESDWDENEISYNFQQNSLVSSSNSNNLHASYQELDLKLSNRRFQLKKQEEEINSLLIGEYDLNDELTNEVFEELITLKIPERGKECQLLISYAIGCMMGRYSLDEPGLIYAHSGNVGFEPGRYTTFPADADGILPITDELWFADDAPSRISEFLRAVWGPDTLEENMAWLAESLGSKASETPDETIRRYIADKFFKDHLQTYKKRPIYWLFSSGKQGAFQALVYLHRYHEGTLARLRAEYVVPLTGKIQSRIEMMQKDASAASSTAARNKLAKEVEKLQKKHVELLAYDEQLRHYADMRITMDLDDGVKVNYGKFGNLLAEVKAVTGGASDD